MFNYDRFMNILNLPDQLEIYLFVANSPIIKREGGGTSFGINGYFTVYHEMIPRTTYRVK